MLNDGGSIISIYFIECIKLDVRSLSSSSAKPRLLAANPSVGQLQRDIKNSSSHPSQMSEVTLRFYIVNFESYLSIVAADRVIC